jgi:hypothetical protein
MGGRVKEDGRSEGRTVMERIRVELMATSLCAKASRLPSGLSSRENLINRLGRESR